MAYWLASHRSGQETDWIQRFDPRFWTVNFPRPMLACAITPAPDALKITASFLTKGDLAGLIWDSQDSLDHPLLAYDTNRDYRRTNLSFRWQSDGVEPLDANNGPTLTIEGRDASGAPRNWYVRLWNFARGSGTDAQITLNFSDIYGGWSAATGADPVYAGDIDRMFISLVPEGFNAGSTDALDAPVDGWVELSNIRCWGHNAMLRCGNVFVPPHGAAAATGYDDCYNQTPARVIRNMRQLGYRGSVLHYVGMSHAFRLQAYAGGYKVATSGDPLCAAARAWHAAFFAQCKAAGYAPIASQSFEVLADQCPDAWQQMAADGTPARTGWSPPSALLSPAHSGAAQWQASVATAFAGLLADAGCKVRYQIGEPWWWVTTSGTICLYDDATKAAFGGNLPALPSMDQPMSAAQLAVLDKAGQLLAAATGALAASVRNLANSRSTSAEVMLLAFLPTVLSPTMPELQRANLPVGWAYPAFDRLQVEDYDWLTAGATAQRQMAYAQVNTRLNYPQDEQDYLAGFVLLPSQTDQWRAIDSGMEEAMARGCHEIFVWALPQVCRDGFVHMPAIGKDDTMNAFDDVLYPLALPLNVQVAPEFSTNVITTASGHERRNTLWSDARLRFDVGPGVRSDDDLGKLIAFFRARRGAARGFRLQDPCDFSSNGMTGTPTPTDQLLGVGDGKTLRFNLVKRYGEDALGSDGQQTRRITRPRVGSVMISVKGIAVTTGWTLGDGGAITFVAPPEPGSDVRAGFLFDVPVRFEQDRLNIIGTSFQAGEAPSVPAIELKEAS